VRTGAARPCSPLTCAAAILALGLFAGALCGHAAADDAQSVAFTESIGALAAFGDRSTGTAGNARAADYIRAALEQLFPGAVATHAFTVPVIRSGDSALSSPGRPGELRLRAMAGNAVTPPAAPPPGLSGPLVYVGSGGLRELNGRPIEGALLLMELDSGTGWLTAADLGASALVYVDRGQSPRMVFEDKLELSPLRFPRFWATAEDLARFFGDFAAAPGGVVAQTVRIRAGAAWENAPSENIVCLIPGSSAERRKEVLVVEAFYDTTAWVAGLAPGADEAVGAATLLQLARGFKDRPPERTVLLVATSGHAQALAGLRELVWALTARSKDLRDARSDLRRAVQRTRATQQALAEARFDGTPPPSAAPPPAGGAPDGEAGAPEDPAALLREALEEQLKTEADLVSRRLMQLRLADHGRDPRRIQELSAEREQLRRLSWRGSYEGMSAAEQALMLQIATLARDGQQRLLADLQQQLRLLESAARLRSSVQEIEIAAAVSLHLSSHGGGFGAFNYGWLYPLRPRINRVPAYAVLEEALQQAAPVAERAAGAAGMFKDTLRPSQSRSWQTYFLDKPALGGEVFALAGIHGITLATTGDARPAWGTPADTPDRVDLAFAARQAQVVCGMLEGLSRTDRLRSPEAPRNGFSTISGRAKFLRQGELFADKPAPGTVLLGYQANSRFYGMVDQRGRFSLKGVADKTHSFYKVVLEGYRFDPLTGEAAWVIDKKSTPKDAYRVRMNRRAMESDLIMFAGQGTTLFSLLEPRTFRHLTKADVLDGRREAEPAHWFMSRLDTLSSTIGTFFLEPGTPLKLTLSDTVLRRKLVAINASERSPIGVGYDVSDTPRLHRTEYHVARDMWTLLRPRIANLEQHGIFNEHLRQLQEEGTAAVQAAEVAWSAAAYDRFAEASSRAWALATRVYDDVEKTQKDVLYGVLFYIALFVPFAFCLERLLFAYANIYKRLIAQGAILLLLVAVIYQVHPAFQLAYSPMVVILAFLIMGLSLIVTLIIFFRFEHEMSRLQSRARVASAGEIGRWKAFVAAFLLGVSNLRRRRVRTALTCVTLVLLTFTIMSFTSVKSLRRHARILYSPGATYQGFLLKNVNWGDLPSEALGAVSAFFAGKGLAVPRAWLEEDDVTRTSFIPLRANGRSIEALGMMGLSHAEPQVSGLADVLTAGRWFGAQDRRAVLISERLAESLGLDPRRPEGQSISLWGMDFDVAGVFAGRRLQGRLDLDGEPLTPVTFPREVSAELSEEEVESLESGDDVREFQSRYQHTPADLTVIIPYPTLMAMGGSLKAIAVSVDAREVVATARELVDRFGLSLFSGEPEGTFLYHASDTMSYSGVPNIIIPLVISVCIVLNTMIGSVYERKREIAVYTSVGLAPSHVSFLFIAEAMAFAVLSVVFGYLLAQTTAWLFAGTSVWAGITVNYSSMGGVAAMLLVMAVVLLSAIYPSRVAGQIAIPDVNRSWTLPPADGNTLAMVFPFLMTYREHRSVGGFLHDFFEGHFDVSHGRFSTSHIDIAFACETAPGLAADGGCNEERCELGACLRLNCRVWLAPFDFGIMQQAELRFTPSRTEPGFVEIQVALTRESGEAHTWWRINKGFLHEIRRQLLIWRSLDDAAKAHFEERLAQAVAAPATAPVGHGRTDPAGQAVPCP
jgi:hypothetical protein